MVLCHDCIWVTECCIRFGHQRQTELINFGLFLPLHQHIRASSFLLASSLVTARAVCSQKLISLCAGCCWWLYASCRWWHAVALLDCCLYSHFSSLCVSVDRVCFPLACSHLLLLFFVIFDSSFRLSKSIYIDLAYRHAGRPCRVLYVRTPPSLPRLLFVSLCMCLGCLLII